MNLKKLQIVNLHLALLVSLLLPATCQVCPGRGDVVLMVDSSGSINRSGNNWAKVIDFLQRVVTRIGVSSNGIRFAAITFSDYPLLEFRLDTYFDIVSLRDAISRLRYLDGFTNFGDTFAMARKDVFSPDKDRNDSVNIAILVTDGKATVRNESTIYEATLLKQKAVVMAVGVTQEIDLAQLYNAATNSSMVFQANDFVNLVDVINRLVTTTCQVVINTPMPTTATPRTTTTTPRTITTTPRTTTTTPRTTTTTPRITTTTPTATTTTPTTTVAAVMSTPAGISQQAIKCYVCNEILSTGLTAAEIALVNSKLATASQPDCQAASPWLGNLGGVLYPNVPQRDCPGSLFCVSTVVSMPIALPNRAGRVVRILSRGCGSTGGLVGSLSAASCFATNSSLSSVVAHSPFAGGVPMNQFAVSQVCQCFSNICHPGPACPTGHVSVLGSCFVWWMLLLAILLPILGLLLLSCCCCCCCCCCGTGCMSLRSGCANCWKSCFEICGSREEQVFIIDETESEPQLAFDYAIINKDNDIYARY